MKNYILNKKYCTVLTIVFMMFASLLFNACNNNDDSSSSGQIIISKVYLEDVNSSVPDRQVKFARLGQIIRIEGAGFEGLKKVYINGFETYFNVVYVSRTSMLVALSEDTPIIDADPAVRNTIRFVNDSNEVIFPFEIRSLAPVIREISNTLPNVGEMITVYGDGLTEVKKVVFPGNVTVTEGITYDPDGEFFTVTMPAGVSPDGGALFVESANGGVYSPAFFNFKKGVILNFDGMGTHGFWGSSTSMLKDTDLESATLGTGNVSQGKYVSHRPSRIASFAAGTNRCSEVWTAGNGVDDWRGQLTPYIPASTPLNEVGLQFDIYVPNTWENTGFLKICLANNFNGGEWAGACYNYVPWIVNGKVAGVTSKGWITITIPLNKFYSFAKDAHTFDDVLKYREAASYQNFGFYFENSDIKLSNVTGEASEVEFPSSATSVSVYTDNWRIVSLKIPTYSDYPN